MKLIVHRGARQIGGCITEIATEGARILIDLGSNLPGESSAEFTREQVDSITHGANAIFYTHYHGDHVGLMSYVKDERVAQYIGEGAKEVMLCKYHALNKNGKHEEELRQVNRLKTYVANHAIPIMNERNEIKMVVTPYFVSHSAFDSNMFKIEVEGKTILHMGDFRGHGYLSKGLFRTLFKYVGQVDFLIIEGTMLSRASENVLHENDIKWNTINYLKQHKYVFALCSSTDIDRLASFYQACKKTHREFLCDKYQSDVLDIFSKYAGAKSKLYLFRNQWRDKYLYMNRARTHGFLRLIRASIDMKNLDTYLSYVPKDQKPCLIYSMWQGYHNGTPSQLNPNIIAIRNRFDKDCIADGTRDGFHTSGHATFETIEQVCNMVNPRMGIIPIHRDKNSTLMHTSIAENYRIIETSAEVEGVRVQLA